MSYIDIVFDGPPGHESGRFVEVENAEGRSVHVGEWLQRSDGYWVLRIEQAADSQGPLRAERATPPTPDRDGEREG